MSQSVTLRTLAFRRLLAMSGETVELHGSEFTAIVNRKPFPVDMQKGEVRLKERERSTIEWMMADSTTPVVGESITDSEEAKHRITKVKRTDLTWVCEDCEISR